MIQDIILYFVYLPILFTAFGMAYFAFKEHSLHQSQDNAWDWRRRYNNLTKR